MPHSAAILTLRAFAHGLALLFIPLLLAAGSYAQSDAPNCPPPAAAPTPEKMQALFKEAKDRGFLWKIEKAGRSGYLYGSMHLGKQEWMVPGPRTLAAAAASEVIALELDILDASIQTQLADPGRYGFKPFALPPPLQKRVDALARRVCAPSEGFATQHPVVQFITLSLLDARFADLEISYGTEIFLAGFARGAKKRVVSLESAESQMRVLLAGEPREHIEALERGIALYETGKSRVVTRRLADAWASGNLGELQDYQRWCECADTDADRKALQKLNDGRNPGLAAGVDRLLAGGQTVFAAVGALHMVGPRALPRLLQEMGYKVERVIFDP